MMLAKDFLVIGHKGSGDYVPENTIKAILKAIELGADYVEFDIHKTKDNEIIAIHDVDTYKTTGVAGFVKNMTLKEIKKLDAGDGEQIPTLDEIIQVAKGHIKLQIEIKAEGLIDELFRKLNGEDLVNSSIISSFSITELNKLKSKDDNLKIAYLLPAELKRVRFVKNKILIAAKKQFYAIHPHYNLVTKEIVNFSHKYNLKVNVWTVNDEINMKNLIKLGVDGIITDEIALLKTTLKQMYR